MNEALRNFYLKHLYDIKEECDLIEVIAKDLKQNFTSFAADKIKNRALRSSIEIIGEAISRIYYKESGKKMNYETKVLESVDEPVVPNERLTPLLKQCKRFNTFKNYIKHSYDTVNVTLLWKYAHDHVPALSKEVHSLIDHLQINSSLATFDNKPSFKTKRE